MRHHSREEGKPVSFREVQTSNRAYFVENTMDPNFYQKETLQRNDFAHNQTTPVAYNYVHNNNPIQYVPTQQAPIQQINSNSNSIPSSQMQLNSYNQINSQQYIR
jgi:hypothetical protein